VVLYLYFKDIKPNSDSQEKIMQLVKTGHQDKPHFQEYFAVTKATV
jgi:hypothetical protein